MAVPVDQRFIQRVEQAQTGQEPPARPARAPRALHHHERTRLKQARVGSRRRRRALTDSQHRAQGRRGQPPPLLDQRRLQWPDRRILARIMNEITQPRPGARKHRRDGRRNRQLHHAFGHVSSILKREAPARSDRSSHSRSTRRADSSGDNAALESFFALLQKNVVDSRAWFTREQRRIATIIRIDLDLPPPTMPGPSWTFDIHGVRDHH